MEIAGNCPMGCGEGLILAEGGQVFCADLLCPRPAAAAEILAEAESEHVVTFTADGFVIRHPLRERLDNALVTCELHAHLAGQDEAPLPTGTYRARRQPGKPGVWYWEARGQWVEDRAST